MLHGTRALDASIDVGLATHAELDAASCLVHECYVRRGYVRRSADGRHVNPYLALPSTAVFVVRADGEVVATVSLIPDSELQLPCDALYGAELYALRATGRRLAEVSALAVSERWRGAGLGAMRALVRVVGVYGREFARVDDLCVAVHPRHAPFYEARLRFQRFGRLKAYDAVNGAPAVGLRLDLARLDEPLGDASFAGAVFGAEERARTRDRLERDLARLARAQPLQILQAWPAVGAPGAAEVC